MGREHTARLFECKSRQGDTCIWILGEHISSLWSWSYDISIKGLCLILYTYRIQQAGLILILILLGMLVNDRQTCSLTDKLVHFFKGISCFRYS